MQRGPSANNLYDISFKYITLCSNKSYDNVFISNRVNFASGLLQGAI